MSRSQQTVTCDLSCGALRLRGVFTCLPFIPSTPSRVGASHDIRERTVRLLSEGTGISAENVAGAEGLSSYESTPSAPITDINWRPLFAVAKVQNHIQEGFDFRTEDYFRFGRPARESLVLGGSDG
jgi:hypothetical protein